MADRRRYRASPTRPRSQRSTRARRGGGTNGASTRRALALSPHVLRSLLGLALIVLGAVTVVALMFESQGLLSRYVNGVLRPNFGVGAWLLALLLIVGGVFVERSPRVGNGWAVTALGGVLLFVAGLGLIHLLMGNGASQAALHQGGGAVGRAMSTGLVDLLGFAGGLVILVGLALAGLILLLNTTLRELVRPIHGGGRVLASAVASPVRAITESGARTSGDNSSTARRGRTPVPVMDDETGGRKQPPAERPAPPPPDLPQPSPAPISQTVWSSDRVGGLGAEPAPAATAVATAEARTWRLPGAEVLGDRASRPAPVGGARLDHARNIRIIEEKLRSFAIPATVTATNTGPVVTQYEVRPDAHVKLSRIESLADDLAMALAARSIRIEAPIPGRDVVGIEIPNHASEVVGFGGLVEDSKMLESTSKLTFALGRDVSGKPYAVDLARMPHLLIAGATGSGKSVCVNALIASLLLRATPDELQLVLIDLKRVELAAYQKLPHLAVRVLVESHEVQRVLNNLVGEMEERYRTLADAGQRNIGAYNLSLNGNADAQRMPYLVVVIDELADLILKEGRKVEEPIVKLAQKARAVGIHLVLATQRPSVNVVTGLIKANVPSRIAFAMASNVDSRTVLDAPGAEDLIGRGDMLYQPADLPRPVRLQGVFVSDDEVRAVTSFWQQQGGPELDERLLEGADGEGGDDGGQFGWLARIAEDELTVRAAELVMQTGKASTSMMQTKLKVGFNRATRLMDQLERFGIVGPLDPRNPAVPRVVYGPDNWLRGPADVDRID
ncbi:MAG TPA: DNA translocase FtsK 4TM domain-containing protein [Candidatus Limnocylindrales bacterium]|jgi:DNA segregation ATPase FtsK/SpoIIIE, S-DNA-T family|nr:DNA translocase FtsK 4TM domain-containing protein [Candidatus Limnocylindrales bacterium]